MILFADDVYIYYLCIAGEKLYLLLINKLIGFYIDKKNKHIKLCVYLSIVIFIFFTSELLKLNVFAVSGK